MSFGTEQLHEKIIYLEKQVEFLQATIKAQADLIEKYQSSSTTARNKK